MEPSQRFNSTVTLKSFQMSYEENSPGDSVSSNPETLLKDLHNLSLNPSINLMSPLPEGPPQALNRSTRFLQGTRGGFPSQRKVRTVLSVRRERERLERLGYIVNRRFSQLERREQSDIGLQGDQNEARSVPFKCTCSFCVKFGWDPSENARIGNDDNKLT